MNGLDAFTPEYASPEQLAGKPVTTASDIYSLGAVLQKITQSTIPHADLQSIVAMAMRVLPTDRYPTADQFRDDIRRFLEHRPVQSKPARPGYVARRFLNRHPLAVSAATIFVLVVLAGMAATLWQQRRAEIRLAQLLEMANSNLFDVSTPVDKVAGATRARAQLVRNTLVSLDRLAKDTGDDSRVLFALGNAYLRVADAQGNPLKPNLGDLEGAAANYAKASAILVPLLDRDRSNLPLRVTISELHQRAGQVLDALGKIKEAVEKYKQSVAVVSGLHDLAAQISASQSRYNMVKDLRKITPLVAKKEAEELIASNEELARSNPENRDVQNTLADSYSLLGTVHSDNNQLLQGLEDFRKSIQIREKLHSESPHDSSVQRDLMIGYGHEGDILGSPYLPSLGDMDGAVQSYRKAAAIAEEMSSADPSDSRARNDLAVISMRVGCAMNRPSQALASFQSLARAEKIMEPLLVSSPRSVIYGRQLGVIYQYKGLRMKTLGNTSEAIRYYRKSLEAINKVLKQSPDDDSGRTQFMSTSGQLALSLAENGQLESVTLAQRSLLAAREGAQRYPDKFLSRVRVAQCLGVLAEVHLQLGSKEKAEEYFKQALEEWKQTNTSVGPEQFREERRRAQQGAAGHLVVKKLQREL